MTSRTLNNTFRFIFLILLQVMVLNNINLFGNLNPQLYILFILLYPFNSNQSVLLVLSFLLGLGVDFFENSGGINAAASLVIAAIRPWVLRFSFGVSYDYQTVKFSSTPVGARLSYVGVLILVHHFCLFLLEFFSFAHLLLILEKTIFTGLFTLVLVFLSLALFNRKK